MFSKFRDDQWKEFNNFQRAHYNYVESAASVLTTLLVSGLFYPRVSSALGIAYIIGRQLYAHGYRKEGPKGRLLGAGILDVSLIGLLGTGIYGVLSFIGLI